MSQGINHYPHHSVGNMNLLQAQINGYNDMRLRTPIKNNGFLKDMTNKYENNKTDHVRKSSANLPKIQASKTPRIEGK